MADPTTQNASLLLYKYMCQNIVGSEKHVKTVRAMNNVRDHLQTNKSFITITSGSYGEGLQLQGSDLDIMVVRKYTEVCEDINFHLDPRITYFTMDTEDTQLGFTKLRLIHSHDQNILEDCEKIGNGCYFSNSLVKQRLSTEGHRILHGPCLTDKHGILDVAFCVRSKSWITPAKQWITRSNNAWPGYSVKEYIVEHGVIFVPVGVKGSTQEELEWRISFSVGEKLLINTFTHTQFLCYALIKIFLKDVICLDFNCQDLLCSYFMKTIMFWISEELPQSIWEPENLICCFMRCFRRLVYCVEYSVCPLYFIPEINLFENKIKGHTQKMLLDKLYILNRYGWKCILLSDRISKCREIAFNIYKESFRLSIFSLKQHLSFITHWADHFGWKYNLILEKSIQKSLSIRSSNIKSLYTYFMSKLSSKNDHLHAFKAVSGNISTYKLYYTYTSILLLAKRHDAVSGWLLLASFFYGTKQYNNALEILQYSLSKCTPEKIYRMKKFSCMHHEIPNLEIISKMSIVQMFKLLVIETVSLTEISKLIPHELQMELEFLAPLGEPYHVPPVVFAHFLCFLCHYHLNNVKHYRDSLQDLQLTIQENYFIDDVVLKGTSYNILGISFQLVGDLELARQAYIKSTYLDPNKKYNSAFLRLSRIV